MPPRERVTTRTSLTESPPVRLRAAPTSSVGPLDLAAVTSALAAVGCVAADEEAEELVAVAADDARLRQLLERRLTGEPLAWVTGSATFCGLTVGVEPGVYVPRWQSEPMVRVAVHRLPPSGIAVDLCTGSGALGLVLQAARPAARVIGTELDPVATACARRNGLEVVDGDLDEGLPDELAGRVDVMIGVLPYVPDDALHLLPRDVQAFEPRLALDGGAGGLSLVARAVERSPRWLRRGGWLLLEIGGDQAPAVTAMLAGSGYRRIEVLDDEDGDPRAVMACLGADAG